MRDYCLNTLEHNFKLYNMDYGPYQKSAEHLKYEIWN